MFRDRMTPEAINEITQRLWGYLMIMGYEKGPRSHEFAYAACGRNGKARERAIISSKSTLDY
jgi:hypothetical protein